MIAGTVCYPPHSRPEECNWWHPQMGNRNGCPHFSTEHWSALAAAGQLPELALAGGWHGALETTPATYP